MATRYVWKRASATTSVTKSTTATNLYYYTYEILSYTNTASFFVWAADDYTATTSSVTLTNPTIIQGLNITIPKGKYFAFTNSACTLINSSNVNSDVFDMFNYSDDDNWERPEYAYVIYYAKTECKITFPNASWSDENQWFEVESGTLHVALTDVTTTIGSYDTYVSSSSRYTYPDNGTSGSYHYVYLTSGSIDPTAVSITTTSLTVGSTATIKVTPRSNSYGTVSYTYQYKANSGAWTTIATSSATSYNFTIPSGTTSIQFRVRAQDNIGFTSTDYVTSGSYSVSNYTTYAGVSGVTKGVSVKVGVGGAVRSASAKKCVGGVIKS